MMGGDAGPNQPTDSAARLKNFLSGPTGGTVGIVVSPHGDAGTIRRALDGDAWCFLELDPSGNLPDVAVPEDTSGPPWRQLLLALTTGTAFSLDGAVLICDRLVVLGVLADSRRPELELAIHEALSNAIIHGNLGVRRGASSDPGSFDRFYAAVQGALAVPDVARRRITAHIHWDAAAIHVSITDEGRGFDAETVLTVEPDAKSGRGLQIIRRIADRVAFSDHGRCIQLSFRR